MPWVRFTSRFDWSPPPFRQRRTTVFQAGQTLLVTTACAKSAVAAGKAVPVAKPKQEHDNGRG